MSAPSRLASAVRRVGERLARPGARVAGGSGAPSAGQIRAQTPADLVRNGGDGPQGAGKATRLLHELGHAPGALGRHSRSYAPSRTERSSANASDPPSRRGAAPAIALALGALAFLLLAHSALASTSRSYTTSFGLFTNPQALTVDQASGDVYVVDASEGTVSRFDSSGTPHAFTCATCSGNALSGFSFDFPSAAQVAIAPAGALGGTAGDIYVVSFAGVDVFANDGTALGTITQANGSGFSESCGVATDNAGKLYVGDFGGNVDRYVPTADPPTNGDYDAQLTGVSSPCNVAADSTGALYASTWSTGPLTKYAASDFGTSNPGTQIDATSTAVAVDPSSDDVYVDEGNKISVFDSSGAALYSFGSAADFGTNSVGVAVKGSGGNAYVADRTNGEIDVFGPAATFPDATTGSADNLAATGATLHGTVNPDGVNVTDCHFDYGTTTAYGQSAPCTPGPGSGSGDVAVSADISGLSAATTYHFRLVATNANGTTQGTDATFATAPAVKDLVTEPATDLTATSATLNGTLDPDGVAVTDCHFDYTTDADFQANGFTAAQQASCVPDPGSGSGAVAVSAAVSGLSPGTLHHFRLVATNANGTTTGAALSFRTLGPRVISESVAQVSSVDAVLRALINPSGDPTTYHFQYTTDADFQANGYSNAASVPIPDASAGAGTTDLLVSQPIAGLTPLTTYRFRVVATNPGGTTEGPGAAFTTYPAPPSFGPCPNDAFRAGPGARLPDCRAYEQATPVDKHGSDVIGTPGLVGAAASGAAVTFVNAAGLPSSGGSSDFPIFAAVRGASAWATPGMMPATDPGFLAQQLGWNDELTTALSDVPGDAGEHLYSTDVATGTHQPVASLPLDASGDVPRLAAFSSDPAHLTFESRKVLAPGAVSGAQNLYDLDHGAVTLAGRVPAFPATSCDDATHAPDCIPAPTGSFAGPYHWANHNAFGNGLDVGGAAFEYYLQNTLSADGSKAFFTERGTGRLYMRTDGTRTVQINASQASSPDPNGHKPAAFLGATPSGSRVFFSSCEHLTDDSTAFSTVADSCTDLVDFGGGDAQGSDLYAYDTASGELTDLTPDPNPDPRGADVIGILGSSADGSDAYFVANGVLAPGATPGDCIVPGAFGNGHCNLYLSHDGHLTFITRLSNADNSPGSALTNWQPQFLGRLLGGKNSRVAADGTLLLTSYEPLTAYDNTEATAASCSDPRAAGNRCTELYRYRPGDPGLTCVSCDPTGAAPTGDATTQSTRPLQQAGGLLAPFLTRNLSADGNRVFFDTGASLLPADTNGAHDCARNSTGSSTCTDVYEWEAAGTGSCDTATVNGGCLYLLSTGTSGSPSFFADASASGNDAFFFTRDALVPQDTDQLTDVYDARSGGGLAFQHPAVPPPCTGDACQAPPSSPPTDPGSGSSTNSGPGNQGKDRTPAAGAQKKKCKKGKKHKKAKKGKKHKKAKCVKKHSRAANTTGRAGR